MMINSGEKYQNSVAELIDICEWIMTDLYSFAGNIFV